MYGFQIVGKPNKNQKNVVNKKSFKIERWQVIAVLMLIYDIIAVNISYASTLWLRFDFRFSRIPAWYWETWKSFAPIYTVFCITIFWLLRMYRSIWKFASVSELVRVVLSSIITGVFHIVAVTEFYGRMPVTYFVLGTILQFLLVLTVRFAYRFVYLSER